MPTRRSAGTVGSEPASPAMPPAKFPAARKGQVPARKGPTLAGPAPATGGPAGSRHYGQVGQQVERAIAACPLAGALRSDAFRTAVIAQRTGSTEGAASPTAGGASGGDGQLPAEHAAVVAFAALVPKRSPTSVEALVNAKAPVAAQVRQAQAAIAALQYLMLPCRPFFSLRKGRPLQQLLSTAREMLHESLPIRCLEATFLALLLTQHLAAAGTGTPCPSPPRTGTYLAQGSGTIPSPPPLVAAAGTSSSAPMRVPLAFASVCRGRTYRHIVLCLYCGGSSEGSGGFGALGLSRRTGLMDKPCRFASLAALIAEYAAEYERVGHRLASATVGLPVSYDSAYGHVPPCWRFLTVRAAGGAIDAAVCDSLQALLPSLATQYYMGEANAFEPPPVSLRGMAARIATVYASAASVGAPSDTPNATPVKGGANGTMTGTMPGPRGPSTQSSAIAFSPSPQRGLRTPAATPTKAGRSPSIVSGASPCVRSPPPAPPKPLASDVGTSPPASGRAVLVVPVLGDPPATSSDDSGDDAPADDSSDDDDDDMAGLDLNRSRTACVVAGRSPLHPEGRLGPQPLTTAFVNAVIGTFNTTASLAGISSRASPGSSLGRLVLATRVAAAAAAAAPHGAATTACVAPSPVVAAADSPASATPTPRRGQPERLQPALLLAACAPAAVVGSAIPLSPQDRPQRPPVAGTGTSPPVLAAVPVCTPAVAAALPSPPRWRSSTPSPDRPLRAASQPPKQRQRDAFARTMPVPGPLSLSGGPNAALGGGDGRQVRGRGPVSPPTAFVSRLRTAVRTSASSSSSDS